MGPVLLLLSEPHCTSRTHNEITSQRCCYRLSLTARHVLMAREGTSVIATVSVPLQVKYLQRVKGPELLLQSEPHCTSCTHGAWRDQCCCYSLSPTAVQVLTARKGTSVVATVRASLHVMYEYSRHVNGPVLLQESQSECTSGTSHLVHTYSGTKSHEYSCFDFHSARVSVLHWELSRKFIMMTKRCTSLAADDAHSFP
jgi:hypothetical protein